MAWRDVVDLTGDEAPVAWEPLRIGASQVGACVGVHPWAEVDELFEGLVWQGAAGPRRFRRDPHAAAPRRLASFVWQITLRR